MLPAPRRGKWIAIVKHGLTGLGLGVALGLSLAATDAGTLYGMLAREYGPVGGMMSVTVGFGLVIGVGSGITGHIFEEVDKTRP